MSVIFQKEWNLPAVGRFLVLLLYIQNCCKLCGEEHINNNYLIFSLSQRQIICHFIAQYCQILICRYPLFLIVMNTTNF